MYQSSILVTGGTTGLGYQAAIELARSRPSTQVVIVSRSDKEHAADTINKKLNQSNVVFKHLDLSYQDNIRAFAKQWNEEGHPIIEALVLNAGLQFAAVKPEYSKDGLEMTFATNHLGHALLFYLLRPHLSQNCRIVITSSGTHDPAQKTMVPDALYTSADALAHPSGESLKVGGQQRYSTSKLCNVLWTYALDRHIREEHNANSTTKWTVNTMDPGLMLDTSLSRDYPAPLAWIARNILANMLWLLRLFIGPNVHTSAKSGTALARLAIADDVQGVSGKYFEGLKERNSSEASHEIEKQEDLWTGTVNLIARDEKERQSFQRLT